MLNIDLVFCDVTSGHRSAAQALQGAFARSHPTANARMVNLVDLLAGQRSLQRLAIGGIDFFRWGVRRELALLPEQQIGRFQVIQRSLPTAAQAAIAPFWRDRAVDAVVSVIPLCNLFLQRALHQARPDCRYVIIPVDMEEGRKRDWFEPGADAHYLIPTPRLREQALAAGVPASRATRVSGMPIDPTFYDAPPADRAAALAEAGLAPSLPTVLGGFGGQGSVFVDACARELAALGPSVNVIFLCGRNAENRERIARLATPYRKLVLGFTPEAPARWYAQADVVVGKPGSMTLTEALVTRRPLVASTSNTLAVVQRGQEAWIRAAGVGEVVDLPGVTAAVQRVLREPAHAAAINRQWHRAVFEIADQIVHIAEGAALGTGGAACSVPASPDA